MSYLFSSWGGGGNSLSMSAHPHSSHLEVGKDQFLDGRVGVAWGHQSILCIEHCLDSPVTDPVACQEREGEREGGREEISATFRALAHQSLRRRACGPTPHNEGRCLTRG